MIELHLEKREITFIKKEFKIKNSKLVLTRKIIIKCRPLNSTEIGILLEKLSGLKEDSIVTPKDFGTLSVFIKNLSIKTQEKVSSETKPSEQEIKFIMKLFSLGKDPHPKILADMLGKSEKYTKKLLRGGKN